MIFTIFKMRLMNKQFVSYLQDWFQFTDSHQQRLNAERSAEELAKVRTVDASIYSRNLSNVARKPYVDSVTRRITLIENALNSNQAAVFFKTEFKFESPVRKLIMQLLQDMKNALTYRDYMKAELVFAMVVQWTLPGYLLKYFFKNLSTSAVDVFKIDDLDYYECC